VSAFGHGGLSTFVVRFVVLLMWALSTVVSRWGDVHSGVGQMRGCLPIGGCSHSRWMFVLLVDVRALSGCLRCWSFSLSVDMVATWSWRHVCALAFAVVIPCSW